MERMLPPLAGGAVGCSPGFSLGQGSGFCGAEGAEVVGGRAVLDPGRDGQWQGQDGSHQRGVCVRAVSGFPGAEEVHQSQLEARPLSNSAELLERRPQLWVKEGSCRGSGESLRREAGDHARPP